MPLRKRMRESAFRLARKDLACFLKDHEEDLLTIFREEMADLDKQTPEENLFIDIKMVPLGEAILKAALHAITRFLTDEFRSERSGAVTISARDQTEERVLTLKNTRT